MKNNRAPPRTRPDLMEFLRKKRASILPEDVGLISGARRRTPGLRREEIAALAGVGVVWYTWLEQGRDISVSALFLDNLARVLKLDNSERSYLYLLVHQRLPAETGETSTTVPPLMLRLLDDLQYRPTYILNLRWDVLAWNSAADAVFNFSKHPKESRNFLWLLFTDKHYKKLIQPYTEQLVQIVHSFRRDYVKAVSDVAINDLISKLEESSAGFRKIWHDYEIYGPCSGIRDFYINDLGKLKFEHYSLTIDEQQHIRMVYYSVQNLDENKRFILWLDRKK